MAAEGSLSHEEAGPDDVQALPLLRVHESIMDWIVPFSLYPSSRFSCGLLRRAMPLP